MSSTFPLTLLLLVVLSTGLFYLIQGSDGTSSIWKGLDELGFSTPTPSATSTPTQHAVPPEFQSGDSRFSQGVCAVDTDCVPTGCSGEVCSSDPNIASTCEFSDSFPNVQGYACGCVAGVCGWH